ncbi:MAG: hypothetical protein WCT05_00385 [Lentisphaeria bacterium]
MLIFLLLCGRSFAKQKSIKLVSDGIAKIQIMLWDIEDQVSKFAAEELQTYRKK